MKKHLSNKDLKIIDYLLATRVATIYQIKEHLFSDHCRTALVKRLNRLCSQKFIRKDSFEFKTVYSLGSRAIHFLKDQGILISAFKPIFLGYNPNSIGHDLILTDLYNRISRLPYVFDLKTHNHQIIEKRSEENAFNISDLLFLGKSEEDTFHFALELEISRKNPKCYPSIFEVYRKNKNLSTILYLVPTESLKRELLLIDEKVFSDQDSKIYVGLLDDFLKQPIQTRFHTWNGFYFDFQSLKSKQEKEAKRKIIKKENITSLSQLRHTV